MNRPMTREEVIKKFPDVILLERTKDDWYECYHGADKCHKHLGLELRNDGEDYVAFPFVSLDVYLPKLIRAGFRIAIMDK